MVKNCLSYHDAQALCLNDYQQFWALEAKRISWSKDFSKVHDGGFAQGKWFLDGKLNASVNCLDRHIADGKGLHKAIIFEDESYHIKTYTFADLLTLTKSIATILHNNGLVAGDRVVIYMPIMPESIASMLACARLGIIHTVVFAGFAKDALIDRIYDAQAKAIITIKDSKRKGHILHLKDIVLDALTDSRCNSITKALCFGAPVHYSNNRMIPYQEEKNFPSIVEHPCGFASDHPLFILYTSGTTGKPKGIMHKTGGYLVQTVATTAWIFNLNDNDIFWSSADIGWITGHSYGVYGPLSLGKTIFIYNGALNWPNNERVYDIIARHKVTVFYTAPTAIRMLMRSYNNEHKFDLSSLRLLGSVGEPINPEAWHWYHKVLGRNICPIVDTWWQTETGAIMLSAIPGVDKLKPGSASKPFLGIKAEVVNDHGDKVLAKESGYLVIKQPWPSLALGIFGDEQKFLDTYFNKIPGTYFTGDAAQIDDDGDFIINGRIDDVINVSGHRLGSAEIESALVAHPSVAEAAVVGAKDDITGQKLVAFITLMPDIKESEHLITLLKDHVKEHIGSFARPAEIYVTNNLPKTRSGKIMRRLLRAKAMNEDILTDISTLDDQ